MSAASDLTKVKNRKANPPQTMTVDIIGITPDIAWELYDLNSHNRNINQGNVEKFSERIKRGRWSQNGATICISKTGVLLDGQNRLLAFRKSGETVEYIVVWGLEDEAQEDMDTGSKRSLSQSLHLRGEANPNSLGATVRTIWQVDNGGDPSRWLPEPTYSEYAEYIDSYPSIRSSVDVGNKVSRAWNVPTSPVAAAHSVCEDKYPGYGDDFFSDVANTSVKVKEDSPVKALRDTFARWTTRGGQSRMEQAALYDVCVRAFDDYKAGRTKATPYRLVKRVPSYRLPK